MKKAVSHVLTVALLLSNSSAFSEESPKTEVPPSVGSSLPQSGVTPASAPVTQGDQASQAEQTDNKNAIARIRLFGQNGMNVALYKNSKCKGGRESVQVSGGLKGLGTSFLSLIGAVHNKQIGMPETVTTKNLSDRSMFGAKAFFEEYEVASGSPVTIDMTFGDNQGKHCEPPSITFTPEAGHDYEAALEVNFAKGECITHINQITSDNSLVPVDVSIAPDCK